MNFEEFFDQFVRTAVFCQYSAEVAPSPPDKVMVMLHSDDPFFNPTAYGRWGWRPSENDLAFAQHNAKWLCEMRNIAWV